MPNQPRIVFSRLGRQVGAVDIIVDKNDKKMTRSELFFAIVFSAITIFQTGYDLYRLCSYITSSFTQERYKLERLLLPAIRIMLSSRCIYLGLESIYSYCKSDGEPNLLETEEEKSKAKVNLQIGDRYVVPLIPFINGIFLTSELICDGTVVAWAGVPVILGLIVAGVNFKACLFFYIYPKSIPSAWRCCKCTPPAWLCCKSLKSDTDSDGSFETHRI